VSSKSDIAALAMVITLSSAQGLET